MEIKNDDWKKYVLNQHYSYKVYSHGLSTKFVEKNKKFKNVEWLY
ncbi:hypothetical protein FACS189413_07040 [Bacteroidia bacterium]|nr:hypothetical protein FACS189413_07040 [Bacteroidia bacterium]